MLSPVSRPLASYVYARVVSPLRVGYVVLAETGWQSLRKTRSVRSNSIVVLVATPTRSVSSIRESTVPV